MPATAVTESARPSAALLAVALVFALVFPFVMTYAYFVYLTDAPRHLQQIVYSGGKLIQFAFPLVWVFLVAREKFSPNRIRSEGLLSGIAFGILVAVGMWALYGLWLGPSDLMDLARESVRGKVQGFGLDTLGRFAAMGTFYTIFHSLLEEYYWRWFTYRQLRRLTPVGVANVVSSLGFTAHHVILLGTFFGYDNPITWIFSAAIAVGGAVWAWMYERYQSIYPVWLSHAIVDAAIFSIGYDMVLETIR